MSDQAIEAARAHLASYIERFKRGEVTGDQLLIAGEALLRVLEPGAIEDSEYFRDHTMLPFDEQCGARGKFERVCRRRHGHVISTHRDCEFSWAVTENQE